MLGIVRQQCAFNLRQLHSIDLFRSRRSENIFSSAPIKGALIASLGFTIDIQIVSFANPFQAPKTSTAEVTQRGSAVVTQSTRTKVDKR